MLIKLRQPRVFPTIFQHDLLIFVPRDKTHVSSLFAKFFLHRFMMNDDTIPYDGKVVNFLFSV